MRVLTTRGGELVALAGPVCDNDASSGCAGFTGLDSAHPIDVAIAADYEPGTRLSAAYDRSCDEWSFRVVA